MAVPSSAAVDFEFRAAVSIAITGVCADPDGAPLPGTTVMAIASNTVQEVFEDSTGTLWVGTSWPTEFGGALVSLDANGWRQYTPARSGFSGAETLAIAQDALGRIWIGTWSAGVDVYQP